MTAAARRASDRRADVAETWARRLRCDVPRSLGARRSQPADAALAAALGASRPHWDTIVARVDAAGGLRREWKFYAGSHGWQLKIRDARSALLYLIPRDGRFVAALPLNAEAVAALPGSGLPVELVAAITTAKPSPEGTPARIEVTGTTQVRTVEALIAISLASRRSARAGRAASRARPRRGQ